MALFAPRRKKQVENLSHRQRELTPAPFAEYLVSQVRLRNRCADVVVLWVRDDSPYRSMGGVHCYGVLEDAYSYAGPWPVVCHPPSGPWGKYKAVSKQDPGGGLWAMWLVGQYGGVVEQPVGSRLFDGGQVVNQWDWGHPAQKATKLFWVDRPALEST
jgi:hypothetical protein